MRLQLFFNFSVCVDAYYVPRSCLLVIIKHIYESVCGGTCALVGVTGVIILGRIVLGVTWVFTLLCCLTRNKENTMLQGISSMTFLSIHDYI
jgi:hypothetical protein